MAKMIRLLIAIMSNVPFILVLLGLACFVYAGFLFTQILGYVLLGSALIIVAYILSPSPPETGKGGANR